jgi:MFS family permease
MTAGDYALTAWVPALLSRKFGLGASDFGPTLGTIIMTSGVLGGFTAGLAGDFLSRRHGCVARLYVTIVTLLCALSGCWLALASSAATVLLLCGVWSVLMAIAATSGLVLIQDLLPNTMRGMGTSLAAFGNTIAGLGLGPTLVALATEHAFRDPAAVGVAIATVAAPAIVAAAVCFRLCMLALKDPSPA